MKRHCRSVAIVISVLAAFAPVRVHASETLSRSAPYDADRSDLARCSSLNSPGVTCQTAVLARGSTGALSLSADLSAGSPAYGSAWAQPEIWATIEIPRPTSKIVLTGSFHLEHARAWRDGTLADATSHAQAIAFVDVVLEAVMGDGCRLEQGCTDTVCPLLGCHGFARVRVADAAHGRATHDEVVDVTVTLTPERGLFTAGTLRAFGLLYGEASLESAVVPDDGVAGISAAGRLTGLTAEVF